MRGSDEVIESDQKRLASKVSAVESVTKVHFDHQKRLVLPAWGPKEQRAYGIAAKEVELPTGVVGTLKQMLKP